MNLPLKSKEALHIPVHFIGVRDPLRFGIFSLSLFQVQEPIRAAVTLFHTAVEYVFYV